jgi:hypothetical protein
MNFNQTQKLYWQVGKDNFILKIQDFKKLFILQFPSGTFPPLDVHGTSVHPSHIYIQIENF